MGGIGGDHANSFTFSLTPETIFTKIGELLGNQEIKIGDAEFDQQWRIQANDVATLHTLLTPKLRENIDQPSAKIGNFILENDWIRHREWGDFFNAARVARLESMIGLMCDLADAIEVAAKKCTPLPPVPPPAYDDDKKDDDWGEASPDYDRSP